METPWTSGHGDTVCGDGDMDTQRHGDTRHQEAWRHYIGGTETAGDTWTGDTETRRLEKEETQPVATSRAGAHWPVVCLTCLANQEEMIRQSPGPPCECRAPHF